MRLALLATTLLLAACSGGSGSTGSYGGGVGPGGTTVGAPCTNATQCASLCKSDVCTVACASDLDCPAGSSCIDTAGGVCLQACASNAECPVGYVCKADDRRGGAGKTLVCKKP